MTAPVRLASRKYARVMGRGFWQRRQTATGKKAAGSAAVAPTTERSN